MLDVSRHFEPVSMVERTLDGVAAAKLNVFHWHLSDDQGFRAESKKFPKLTEVAAEGEFYTQDQLREVVAYARARGIRVVPEFDMRGHMVPPDPALTLDLSGDVPQGPIPSREEAFHRLRLRFLAWQATQTRLLADVQRTPRLSDAGPAPSSWANWQPSASLRWPIWKAILRLLKDGKRSSSAFSTGPPSHPRWFASRCFHPCASSCLPRHKSKTNSAGNSSLSLFESAVTFARRASL